MFLFIFLCVVSPLKPLLLIPGIYGSNLVATASHYSSLWYCPLELDHELFWLNDKFIIPPFHNCLFEMLQCYYDSEKDEVTSQPGIHIDVPDFGGSNGMAYIDHGLGDLHLIESFNHMMNSLKNKGYRIQKDLFGVPYDWRMVIVGLKGDFFPRFQRLIERAYRINDNQKVTLLGYSCGGFVVHHFLTQVVDEEWKNKYVEKLIFLAPAISGSSTSLNAAWKLTFPILSFLKTELVRSSVQRLPVIHSMLPNFEVYENVPIIYAPNNETVYAKDIPAFLLKHKKLINQSYAILNKTIPFISKVPQEVGLPVYLMYNDGYDTLISYNMSDEITDNPTEIYAPGDSTLNAFGQSYPCRGWSSSSPLVCHNFHMHNYNFMHTTLSLNSYVDDLIFNVTNNLEWTKITKKRQIVGPFIEMFDDNTYTIRPDIRKQVETDIN